MIHLKDTADVRKDDGAKVLDETAWDAWIAKGALQEQCAADRRMGLAKCTGIVILAATALLWRSLSEYDFFIRLGVSLSGLAILFQALRLRRYAFVAVFAAVSLVYNPVVPVFPLSGTEAFALVVMTTLPFAASLIWLRPARPPNEKAATSSDPGKMFVSSATGSTV